MNIKLDSQADREQQTPDTSAKKVTCPKCGSTDVDFKVEAQEFVCKYCRSRWSAESDKSEDTIINSIEDIEGLDYDDISKGCGDVVASESDVLTFKCPGCGAPITISSSADVGSVRCHWCRHQISVADKMSNGITPDGIIPFSVSKEEAQELIKEALKKKKFFAHPQFIKDFNIDNIRPVYLPYIVVDMHANGSSEGKGAIYKGSTGSDDNKKYHYELYDFKRSFEFAYNDLYIEANSNYLMKEGENTLADSKNVINSILPFSIDSVVDFNPQFLNGDYRAEFRDLNIDDINGIIDSRTKDIVAAKSMDGKYDSGQEFSEITADKIGRKLVSVLAPIWLYSYIDKDGKLNYICCNGQTGETATCIPVNKKKLIVASAIVEFISLIVAIILFILLL